MKQLLSKLLGAARQAAGFTLIELLVVIAIIGVLAVAVLSAINPVEQINRGQDTRLNNDASQLLAASERFYTNNQIYPWNQAAAGFTPGSVDPTTAFTFDSRTGTPNWNWLTNLSSSQEIKDAFANKLRSSREYLIMKVAGANSSTYICYYPKSNAQRAQADRYCQTNGATINAIRAGTCATTDGTAPTTPGTNAICLP